MHDLFLLMMRDNTDILYDYERIIHAMDVCYSQGCASKYKDIYNELISEAIRLFFPKLKKLCLTSIHEDRIEYTEEDFYKC